MGYYCEICGEFIAFNLDDVCYSTPADKMTCIRCFYTVIDTKDRW